MVAAMPYPSGQGTQALVGEMARGLTLREHLVHLVCYHHGAFERAEPFETHRLRKVPLYKRTRSGPDAMKPFLDLMLANKAARVIRRHSCDLVHAHNYEGALAGWWAARKCGVPLVYHAHNLMEDELPRYFESRPAAAMARLAGMGLDRSVPRLAQTVIALHGRLATALDGCGVDESKIRVIEPGIEIGFWHRPAQVADPGPVVGYTGNLDNYQDLPVLFEAMQEVGRRVDGARLLLATPNDPHEALHMAVKHGAGKYADIEVARDARTTRDMLWRCRVAASPRSSWSGFPVKNLNAAAAGVPLVACRGSAFGIEDGRTGLVVPDNDPSAFAEALVSLLAEPGRARRMGMAARKLAEESYSLERMLDGIEQAWESVLQA